MSARKPAAAEAALLLERVATIRATVQAAVRELQQLEGTLPPREEEGVLADLRAELEEARDYLETAINGYLTPTRDPRPEWHEWCAISVLEDLAAREARP
jgi:hypothetical protein